MANGATGTREGVAERLPELTRYPGRDRTRPPTTPLLRTPSSSPQTQFIAPDPVHPPRPNPSPQTQSIRPAWCSSSQNHALCSVSPSLPCSVLPGEPVGGGVPALLWTRRFTATFCAILGRAPADSCSASTARSRIKRALMMSGKYCKAEQTS